MMICPVCGERTRVLESRHKMPKMDKYDSPNNKRKRRCLGCNSIFYTIEIVHQIGEDDEYKIKEGMKKEAKKKKTVTKDIKKESTAFIREFVEDLIISKEPIPVDKIYYRMLFENKNYKLVITRHKIFKALRELGVKEKRIQGVRSFYVKFKK